MNDAGSVKMANAAQHLIEQIAHSLMVEIHLNHLTQIRIHQFHDDVQIGEIFQRFLRCERVQQADDLEDEIIDAQRQSLTFL